jgi:hypothetical protein
MRSAYETDLLTSERRLSAEFWRAAEERPALIGGFRPDIRR